jgi:hypothetical protein
MEAFESCESKQRLLKDGQFTMSDVHQWIFEATQPFNPDEYENIASSDNSHDNNNNNNDQQSTVVATPVSSSPPADR